MKLIEAAKMKKFGIVRKLENYFSEYDFNFKDVRERKDLRIFEIGVQDGGSLAMWKEYFPGAEITGLDIDPRCKEFEQGGVRVYIGSQEFPEVLRTIESERGPFDVVIDDGGHTMNQQIISFNTLFPLLREGGVYVIEDLHTSYWSAFGGRKGKRGTAIGIVKHLIDEMHYWAWNHPRATLFHRIKNKIKPFKALPRNVFQSSIRSIYTAGSICFIHKQTIEKDTVIKM